MAPREIDLRLQRALEAAEGAEVIRDLLSHKADPNLPNAKGQSPLDVVVERDATALCRLLLVYQADPSEWLGQGEQPEASDTADLVRRWGQGDVPTVFAALEELVIDAASAHDVALLGLALASIDIAGGDAEQVAALVDERRNSLLHLCAVGAGQLPGPGAEAAARLTARALLGWGVPVDGRSEKDETALQLALRAMHSVARGGAAGGAPAVPVEPARTLLEARADVEAVDPHTQETLLMQAAKEGNIAACRILLDFGADPLRQNAEGRTAINLCADRPEVALLLRTSLIRRSGEPGALLAAGPAEAKGLAQPRRPGALDMSGGKAGAGDDGQAKAPTPAKTPLARFSLSERDQEPCSAEGLLNQVDLEESYEGDWTGARVDLEESYDTDWNVTSMPTAVPA